MKDFFSRDKMLLFRAFITTKYNFLATLATNFDDNNYIVRSDKQERYVRLIKPLILTYVTFYAFIVLSKLCIHIIYMQCPPDVSKRKIVNYIKRSIIKKKNLKDMSKTTIVLETKKNYINVPKVLNECTFFIFSVFFLLICIYFLPESRKGNSIFSLIDFEIICVLWWRNVWL